MAARRPVERLRFSRRSLLVAVGLLGLTLVTLRVLAASTRVIGWLLAAVAIAALLQPMVQAFSRRMPRGLSVLVVVIVVLGGTGVVGYASVNGIVRQTHRLQRSAPAAARKLERSERYGQLARDFKLVQRTRRFVKEAPARLQGGSAADAIRSAATRSVAFLATGVLSLFFLLHGPRLARSALDQVGDPVRRVRVEQVAGAAYRRMTAYAAGTVLMSVAAGLLAYLVASLVHIPGAAPLGLWVALWDIVPVVGAFIGAVPMVLLALVLSWERALLVFAVFVVYQAFEFLFLQRRVEGRSLHLGPFVTVAGGLVGIELYGIGGGLLALLTIAFAVAVADEVLPQ